MTAPPRLLIVEDDAELRDVVARYLRAEGFDVSEAGDAPSAVDAWVRQRPDLVVLDWMLPGGSGLEVMRHVRAVPGPSPTPVIMLTARGEEPDIVIGLEAGADDYLVKPVGLRQLAARVRAVLRRTAAGPQAPADALEFGDLRIDLAGHAASRAGRPAPLTATEFRLLALLAGSPGRVFSRLQLMEAAIGDYYEGYERTIDSHISHLRHKLDAHDLIQTVHGVGYKFAAPADGSGSR